MRKFAYIFFALLAVQAFATSVLPMSVEQLTAAATTVVRARAISSEARWDDSHTRIYTFTRFLPLEDWKGASGAEFTVRQMGGRVGNIEQKVSGVRRFSDGDEAVLFLRPSEAGAGVMAVVGLFQGNFAVNRSTTQATVTNGVPGVMQLDPRSQSMQQFQAARLSLDDLKQRVFRAMGR